MGSLSQACPTPRPRCSPGRAPRPGARSHSFACGWFWVAVGSQARSLVLRLHSHLVGALVLATEMALPCLRVTGGGDLLCCW